MSKLRVLIVDDAVVVRRILTESLSNDPELEVSSAANGQIALAKIAQAAPDVVTLDMEMPVLDGIATLRELRKLYPRLPVIMFSTLTERGAAKTLDALAAGANDYVTKPSNVGSVNSTFSRIRDELIPKIKALAGRSSAPKPKPSCSVVPKQVSAGVPIDVVAIGVSTGGPNALSTLLPAIKAAIPVPLVIVQHMPAVFTKLLAERLCGQCSIPVKEGIAGMPLLPGQAIIAPGGSHMAIERHGQQVRIATNMNPPENSCRPAVDVLFRSVVGVYGAKCLAVILTGMGSDGLKGCELVRGVGGRVVVQDEATSVVWGMPGFVARAGLAEKQLPIGAIADEIMRRAADGRSAATTAVSVR